MDKLVVLKLGDGSFEQGFPVTLQIGAEEHSPIVEIIGKLPAALELCQYYTAWANAYRALGLRLRLEVATAPVLDRSQVESCYNAARLLGDRLNAWLYAEPFRPIREKLLEQLMPSDRVRLIIQTENIGLRRLPWHLWDFCDRYPKVEVALSAPAYERVELSLLPKSKVRTLAILGDSTGIDIQVDRGLLEQLPNAEIRFLVEPQRQELTDELWRPWDILFFAGHSSSQANGETGKIYLNPTDSLMIDQLKYGLKKAVEQGLQIAIFNSCDGLGLARQLEDLKIPQIIVMREPVPDQVAQEFLKSFLTAFARGETFYLAVREARERLQGLEDEFPCATWLPIICQNPAVSPPTWEALGGDLITRAMPALTVEALPNQLEFSARPAASEIVSSRLIKHRYEIQQVLGQGGFGRTYLAADTHRFGDLCVLKQFAPASKAAGVIRRSRELFEQEAKVLYQINHPQIPKFLAWFTQGAQLFIVQEYIDGKTYLSLLQERRQQNQTFSEAEVVQWLKDLLPVLDYLHGMKIIHRDISPGNVILPRHRSQPVLIDFGIVKEVVSQIWSGQVTGFHYPQQASRVGKPGYAPPEQMQIGQCYPCSDLHALGVTALVLLTGRDPQWLMSQPERRWHAHLQGNDRLIQFFDRLVAENPRDRYQSAQAALTDLQHLSLPEVSTTVAPTRIVAPPPEFHPLPPFNPKFLEYCQQELARCIGPMAGCIIEDTLAQDSEITTQQLINVLAIEIPNLIQAREFKEKIQAARHRLGDRPESSHASPEPSASSQSSPYSTRNPGAAISSPASSSSSQESEQLSPAFLERCRQELARYIGPMASFILEDILTQSPEISRQQLIKAIAAEIPNSQQAKAFQQHLGF
jgi:serine/threonine protein kinase